MANGNGNGRKKLGERVAETGGKIRGSEAWGSIFRPGSPFRKGYADSPRNRSYVIMNNVLYHLHPVKVKRHGVRLSYTLCLGGSVLLPLHPADADRHLPDVLLPPCRRAGLPGHRQALDRRGVRPDWSATSTAGAPTSW